MSFALKFGFHDMGRNKKCSSLLAAAQKRWDRNRWGVLSIAKVGSRMGRPKVLPRHRMFVMPCLDAVFHAMSIFGSDSEPHATILMGLLSVITFSIAIVCKHCIGGVTQASRWGAKKCSLHLTCVSCNVRIRH